MQILALIEIDDEHQFSQVNELYDRLHGLKVKLVPVPEKKMIGFEGYIDEREAYEAEYRSGWNDCVDEIMGEEE